MLERIKNWFLEHKSPILQGVCVIAICLVLLAVCGCNSFSSAGRDSAVSYGLVNAIKGGDE